MSDNIHNPLVSVVIVNYRSSRYVNDLINSLSAQRYRPLEIVVVNNSTEEEIAVRVQMKDGLDVKVMQSGTNVGFAAGNNQGLRSTKGEYLLLLNPDTLVRKDTIRCLVDELVSHPTTDVAVPKLLRMDDPKYLDRFYDGYSRSGRALRIGEGEEDQGQYDERREIFGARGAGVMFRSSFFRDVGMFDERLFSYYEDVDLSVRGQLKGKRFVAVPKSVVLHKGSGSQGVVYSSHSVYLSSRNRLWVYIKNMPGRLMIQHLWRLAWITALGFAFHIFKTRHGLVYLRGVIDALKGMKQTRKEREVVQSNIQIGVDEFKDKLVACEKDYDNYQRRIKNQGRVKR